MIIYEHQDRHYFSSINVTLGTRLYLLGGLVPKLQIWEHLGQWSIAFCVSYELIEGVNRMEVSIILL